MIVAEPVVVQPFASVIVKVFVPAVKPVVAGEMLYGDVPPVVFITTEPLFPPKQSTFTWLAKVLLKAATGSVIVAETVVVQPFASVTVKVFASAVKLVVAGEMLYGDVPPVVFIVTEPLFPPKQSTSTWLAKVLLNAATGSVIVAFTVVVQPFASVIVKVFAPAVKLVVDGEMLYGDVPPVVFMVTEPVFPPKQSTST